MTKRTFKEKVRRYIKTRDMIKSLLEENTELLDEIVDNKWRFEKESRIIDLGREGEWMVVDKFLKENLVWKSTPVHRYDIKRVK